MLSISLVNPGVKVSRVKWRTALSFMCSKDEAWICPQNLDLSPKETENEFFKAASVFLRNPGVKVGEEQ